MIHNCCSCFSIMSKNPDKINVSSPFIFAAFAGDYIWDYFDHFCLCERICVWRVKLKTSFFCCCDFGFQLPILLGAKSVPLVNVTVECETLRFWLLTISWLRSMLPNSCCMIFKSKTNDFTDTGILSSAGYNCEIVYNHEKYLLLHLLPVQHFTVSVLIW